MIQKEKVKGTVSTKKTPSSEAYPWDETHVRADVKKQVLLRLPEPLYLKLAWLARQSPSAYDSMNQIITDGTERLVKNELEKIKGTPKADTAEAKSNILPSSFEREGAAPKYLLSIDKELREEIRIEAIRKGENMSDYICNILRRRDEMED